MQKTDGGASHFTGARSESKYSVAMRGDALFLLLAALTVLGLAAGFAYLSPRARLERRRRKSHSRLIPKAKRPMVRFSVRTPKK